MGTTKIPWCDRAWNPVTGCSRVSSGCDRCYAHAMHARFGKGPFKVTFHPDRLSEPLRWRKPSRVFVCSMGDLFHEDVTDEQRDDVLSVILACNVLDNIPAHRFMILTKRADTMRRYLSSNPDELFRRWAKAGDRHIHLDNADVFFSEYVGGITSCEWGPDGTAPSGTPHEPFKHLGKLFPLPNLLCGVSVENQATADERIPILLQTPAAVRFVSAEPLLGPIRFADVSGFNKCGSAGADLVRNFWVIVGCESGPGARPCDPSWVRSIISQCEAADVPLFVKQWRDPVSRKLVKMPMISGKVYDQFPKAT